MSLDAALLFAFVLLFVRCSAMLLTSPMFGGVTPVLTRVMIGFIISLSLATTVQPYIGKVPGDLWTLALAVGQEALIGILIGFVMQTVIMAAQMAGAFLDLQIGLGAAQIMNPLTANPVSILAQFKFMLALVVFLASNGHHALLSSLIDSYRSGFAITAGSLGATQAGLQSLMTALGITALQIAAPVVGVSIVVDAAIGILNKAVPPMQAYMVGLPAKLLIGLIVLAFGLPLLVVAVQSGVVASSESLARVLRSIG